MEKINFIPEDGMTLCFSLIMLSGIQESGEPLLQEIFKGGCINSADIPGMPEVIDFTKRCRTGDKIAVDNYTYILDGKDHHTRDASKEEIEQITGDGFPFNYSIGVLHIITHEGPDQFVIKNGEIAIEIGDQKMSEKSVNENYIEYLNKTVFPYLDYEELDKSYNSETMDYVKSVLNLLHHAMKKIYGRIFFSSVYNESSDGFLLVPGALEGRNSGKICLALFPIDVHSSGELYDPILLGKYGVHNMAEDELSKVEKKYIKDFFPFVYRYTAYVSDDYECENSGNPSKKMQVLLESYASHNELLHLIDEKEFEQEEEIEQEDLEQ